MRITKILLILALVLVTAVYCVTGIQQRSSGKDSGPSLTCDTALLEISVAGSEDAFLTGVTATDEQDGDISHKIMIQGISKFIDDSTVKVTYIVFDSDGNLATTSRQVRFTDYTSPRFSITTPLRYVSGESMLLLDRVKVTDSFDGDITSDVRVSTLTASSQPEIYTVTLQATNSLGDTARITLPVIVESGSASRPQITLSSYLVYLEAGTTFRPRSYLSSVTSTEGTLTIDDVTVSGSVDTSTPGTYMIYYSCYDSFGTGTAVLTVVVV